MSKTQRIQNLIQKLRSKQNKLDWGFEEVNESKMWDKTTTISTKIMILEELETLKQTN